MGPTHPEPSFKPFVTLVGSAKANAEVHESTRVVVRSRRRMTDLTMRSRAWCAASRARMRLPNGRWKGAPGSKPDALLIHNILQLVAAPNPLHGPIVALNGDSPTLAAADFALTEASVFSFATILAISRANGVANLHTTDTRDADDDALGIG
jgi:hypothetical protein